MPPSVCSSCHNLLRNRLRSRIDELARRRHGSSYTTTSQQPTSRPTIDSLYVDLVPPKPKQLSAATQFFRTHSPRKLWTANEWRKANDTSTTSATTLTPEIVFLGRSNSGKSSLLNALLLSPELCRVGPRPGKTIVMHAWGLSPTDPKTGGALKGTGGDMDTKLTVLDMPGYGYGSRSDWGQEIMKYLQRRKQLRRAFLLLNPKHGMKASDERMIQLLRSEGIVHQIIACKCDEVKPSQLKSALEGLRQQVFPDSGGRGSPGAFLQDVLAVGKLGDGRANQKVDTRKMQGVEDVRWAVLQAVGLENYALAKSVRGKPVKKKEITTSIDPVPPTPHTDDSTKESLSLAEM